MSTRRAKILRVYDALEQRSKAEISKKRAEETAAQDASRATLEEALRSGTLAAATTFREVSELNEFVEAQRRKERLEVARRLEGETRRRHQFEHLVEHEATERADSGRRAEQTVLDDWTSHHGRGK